MRLYAFAPLFGTCCIFTAACHQAMQPAAGRTVITRMVGEVNTAAPDSVEISRADLPTVAARVATLRLVPDSVTLRVGDTLRVHDRVRVLAIDSSGASLGRVPVYDSGMEPGGAAYMIGFGRVVAAKPGVSEMEINFPAVMWGSRSGPPPSARLRIQVQP